MTQHSNIMGGSTCSRRLNCPASWQMENKLPEPAIRETSDYADEGSALHAAMAYMLDNDLGTADIEIGRTFDGYDNHPMTQELIDEALVPCIELIDQVLDDNGDDFVFYVEKQVAMPFLPGVFGTCDFIGIGLDRTVLIDWKFGQGERVEILDENGEPNKQLMFYALGALETLPQMFQEDDLSWPVELWIAQPRHRDGANFDTVTIDVAKLLEFKQTLISGIEKLKMSDPAAIKGSWCRFAPCKAICPRHTGPLFQMTVVNDVKPQRDQDWGEIYTMMLDLIDVVEPTIAEWRTQAHAYLENGGTIDGYKLVNKRGTRKWLADDGTVERKLARLGVPKNERMPRTLITPPQAEKVLKRHNRSLDEMKNLFGSISSGLTLAPDADRRQAALSVSGLTQALASALADIGKI